MTRLAAAIVAVALPAALMGGSAIGRTAVGAPITLTQITTLGEQETTLGGVKLTQRGFAVFGRVPALRKRLGSGWRCHPLDAFEPGRRITWRAPLIRRQGAFTTGLDMHMVSLRPDPGCADDMYVRDIRFGLRGGVLRTQVGSFRIGQRWATVPRAVRELVVHAERNPWGRELTLGVRQDPCTPRRPLAPERRDPSDPVAGLISVQIGSGGRVRAVAVRNTLGEGTAC